MYRCCYCSHWSRASKAKICSDISVHFEEIMAHIEAAANTFWRVPFTNPEEKKDNACGFQFFSAGFACVIKLPKTCPSMIKNACEMEDLGETHFASCVCYFDPNIYLVRIMYCCCTTYLRDNTDKRTAVMST